MGFCSLNSCPSAIFPKLGSSSLHISSPVPDDDDDVHFLHHHSFTTHTQSAGVLSEADDFSRVRKILTLVYEFDLRLPLNFLQSQSMRMIMIRKGRVCLFLFRLFHHRYFPRNVFFCFLMPFALSPRFVISYLSCNDEADEGVGGMHLCCFPRVSFFLVVVRSRGET